MKRPVIIDCDPGLDDVVALMIASRHENLDVRGVTTVGGNVSLEKVTDNALKVLSFMDREDIPVAKGYEGPMVRELFIADDVHGEDGLLGNKLPETKKSVEDLHAIDLMADLVKNSDEKITLIPLAPLTNIAMFIKKYPELMDRIDEIVLMGGAIGGGNTTPAAEFNIYVDPEAAKIVFNSGIPITMIGLNLTHTVVLDDEVIDYLEEANTDKSDFVIKLLKDLSKFHKADGVDGCFLHDPMAVCAAAESDIIRTKDLFVDIETKGELTSGQTVGSFNDRYNENPNVKVGVEIDKKRFIENIYDAVK